MRNLNVWSLGAVLLAISLGSVLIAADKPRLPAGPKPAPPPPEGHRRLADDQIDYAPPEGWVESAKNHTPTRDAFVSKKHDAMMMVEVLPATMKITPDLAASMVKKMKQGKVGANKHVEEPKVEKDDRFVIRIRERYTVKDKIADQLHLYRQVGPRVVLVTTNSLADEGGVKEHHEIGEKVAMTAEYVKK
jgi:hypothetical protein